MLDRSKTVAASTLANVASRQMLASLAELVLFVSLCSYYKINSLEKKRDHKHDTLVFKVLDICYEFNHNCCITITGDTIRMMLAW